MRNLNGDEAPNERAAPGQGKATHSQNIQKDKFTTTKPNTKRISKRKFPFKFEVVLMTLLDVGLKGLNTLEAGNVYSETCLNTSASDIRRNYGLILERKIDPYINKLGRSTPFKRYWLNPNDIDKAKNIVDRLRVKRGMPALYGVDQQEGAA